MYAIKLTLEGQLTKDNNRLNAIGDDLLIVKDMIKLLNIQGLQTVIEAMYDEFEGISDEIGNVSTVLKRARTKETLRSCVHIVNQQSYRVAAFKAKLDNLIEIVNKY